MPHLAALACAVLLAGSLSACTTPHACTAIGWTNALRVHVTGDVGVVDTVTFCAGVGGTAMCGGPETAEVVLPVP